MLVLFLAFLGVGFFWFFVFLISQEGNLLVKNSCKRLIPAALWEMVGETEAYATYRLT